MTCSSVAGIVSYTSLGGADLQLFGWQETRSISNLLVALRHVNIRGYRKDLKVALEIINADLSRREHQILRHLKKSRVAQNYASHPGRSAVVQLLDDFDISMTHKCLVLDVMGPDVQARTDAEKCRRLSRATAESVAHRVALGLDYLWKCGVAHGGELFDLYVE